jgi:nucleoside-diphosphate-sugar epimerase
MKRVLLTGASGAVGAEVLKTLMAQPSLEQIYVLTSEPESAQGNRPEQTTGPALRVITCDLGRPHFGLDALLFAELCDSVDTIFHCAERTLIDQNLLAARAVNSQPMPVLIDLLQRNPAARLVHLSTTLVAGTRRGLFTEFDLACGQDFHNAYEQSKFEAERLLRDSAVSQRIIVVRRSFTMDDLQAAARESGASPLAGLLDSLRRSRLMLIAGDPRMQIDAVSLSYVASSMVALAQHDQALGKTLHVVAGWAQPWPLAAFVSAVRRGLGGGRTGFVPPALSILARALSLLTLGLIAAFPGRRTTLAPYFRHRCVFDNFQARTLLPSLGVAAPSPDLCVDSLLGAAGQS